MDVKNGIVMSGPNLNIQPAAGAQRLGLSSEDLAKQIEPYLHGIEAGLDLPPALEGNAYESDAPL